MPAVEVLSLLELPTAITLILPLHQHPIHTRNPPLRKLRQQLLDHNLQSRIIIPTLLQEVKTRILPRIRSNA
ncbi:hypothetical protein [Komarekiella delphini-convector]|uniref:hypothetical protein n=1 Tax=Komarekiella delphini-convector TaxID=3050158 RepID=UPI00177A7DC5|nr:hypothetical protein [Komarekiella delphini-convector]